jgi:hypothetical protein
MRHFLIHPTCCLRLTGISASCPPLALNSTLGLDVIPTSQASTLGVLILRVALSLILRVALSWKRLVALQCGLDRPGRVSAKYILLSKNLYSNLLWIRILGIKLKLKTSLYGLQGVGTFSSAQFEGFV